MSFDLKSSLVRHLKEGAKQIKEGNPYGGYVYISRAVHSAVVFSDDENIIMLYHYFDLVNVDWLSLQKDKKNGAEFLQNIASQIEEIADAYASDNYDAMNRLLRKFEVAVVRRWREDPLL